MNGPYGLVGSRRVCGKGIVPRGLSGRPVPTSLRKFLCSQADGMLIADGGRTKALPYRFSVNVAATLAFPKWGKGDQRSWWMRMSAVTLWGNALAFDYVWVCAIPL